MRPHEAGTIAQERSANGAREASVAPDAANVVGVADDGLYPTRRRSGPRSRIHAHFDAALLQRSDRALDEALRASERRVALAHDAEPHCGPVVPISSNKA